MTTWANLPTSSFRVGDKIRLNFESNKIRRNVKSIDSEFRMTIDTFIRPSRGFARHVRLKKRNATNR